jgi:hypothetical protein
MTIEMVRPAYADPAPITRALKGLAKVHDLPPFQRLYSSGRATVIVVSQAHAGDWRAAIGAGDFRPEIGEAFTTWRADAFWLGVKVGVVYVTEES